jgi:hypothetical protein
VSGPSPRLAFGARKIAHGEDLVDLGLSLLDELDNTSASSDRSSGMIAVVVVRGGSANVRPEVLTAGLTATRDGRGARCCGLEGFVGFVGSLQGRDLLSVVIEISHEGGPCVENESMSESRPAAEQSKTDS